MRRIVASPSSLLAPTRVTGSPVLPIGRHDRRGAAMVEFAIVGPLTFVLLISLLVGGLGIFRYQQVVRLAQDASRWASVHGASYALATGNSAATAADVYNQVIVPKATLMDLTKLSYSVTWNNSNSQYHIVTTSGSSVKVANTVTVAISYQWIPEAFVGPTLFSGSSTTVMSY